MPRPAALAARLAVAALLATAACGGGGGGGASGPGGVPLDASRPGDALLISALGHYDAANALAAAARAATDPAVAAAKASDAIAEYRLAQADLRRLPVEFPQSIRLDNAAYLDGRCSYEVGTLSADPADFADARDRLDAAEAAFPASPLLDAVAYFEGRTRFQLAAIAQASAGASTAAVQAGYAAARDEFRRSRQASAAGTWADNAAYYLGRADYELGYLAVHPLETGAVAPADGTPEQAAAVASFDRAEAELAAVPAASSYFDNARYYLGRSHLEEPSDSTAAGWQALRTASLDAAVAAFGQVLGIPGSFYRDAAQYWRGRAHQSLAVYAADPAPELGAASADFHAVIAGASSWRDNALYHVLKAYLAWPAPGPYCSALRPGDASPASACAASGALSTLVASDPAFAASTYPALAASALSAAGCACP
ncbi:conserved hypothetical protein [Anaeromyxobacter dehalogenans 2CP-1]|uniref:Lipoprotein n=1 Tax=Anaeromyxobacter dehalogenans (strain ATCC BAA-258 / DSM 21875 / 2CP-1) TaxID=455488 RepID=B8J600_ANAD2|nr:hypothetical protein [Anaeromyxobacter dehalogenans]ACL66895.1 conserved hypothetical protein [Anaeromyxobacter dehalogenans 2CP-1]